MLTGTITNRVATARDILAFYGQMPPRSVRATVYEIDGKPVGIVGFYIDVGVRVMFSDIKAGAPKKAIWREAKAIMADLTEPAVCVATEGSERFLERLGWMPVEMSSEGMVYRWQA